MCLWEEFGEGLELLGLIGALTALFVSCSRHILSMVNSGNPKISKICVLWIFWNWKPVIIPQAVAGVSRSRDAAPPVRDLETQAFHKYDFTRQVRFSRKTSTMSPAVVDCSHRGDVRTPSPAPLQYTESLPNSLDI